MTAGLDGRALTYKQLLDACPAMEDRLALRALAVTGKVHFRWDARVLRVLPADLAEIDEEDARRQRRLLHWLGPSTPAGFARWAGVSRTDVALTWDALRSGLVAVSVSGKPGWVLAEDQAAFAHHGCPAEGQVRFLPLAATAIRAKDHLWLSPLGDRVVGIGRRFMAGWKDVS